MKLTIDISNTENIPEITEERAVRYSEIFAALITSGSLDGVKNGQSILHFDHDANFVGLELKYFPWRKKKPEKTP